MRADAILFSQAMVTTSKSLESDPTMAQALVPLDQVRRQVAAALFGPAEPVTQVGRFQVQKLIGTGGMGVVFAAIDPQLGRTVALKLLQPLTAGERARERLLREAQAMARLQHPNVVGVYEAGVHGEQVYLVMEYVEDGTLAEWLRVRARDWQEVVGVLAQAGEGLAAAHAAGLVHRDFKPKSECPPQTPLLPPSGRILADRGDLRGEVCRVMPRHAAVLATGWQRQGDT